MKTHKIITLFILIIGLSFGYTSCTLHDNSIEINRVDSLLVIAEQLNQNILKIDMEDVEGKMRIVNSDFKFVQDSLPSELFLKSTLFLGQLKKMKKMSDVFICSYASLKKETQYSLDQLHDLKKDLENGSLIQDKIQKYIQDESNALGNIEKHYSELINNLDVLNHQYLENRTNFYRQFREYQASK